MRNLKLLSVILFAAFALSAIAATSAFAEEGEGWLIEGHAISESEGALATESEEELQFEDTSNKAAVLCSDIAIGTMGPETKDETTEVLNVAKEKVEAAKPLLCKRVSTCEESASDIEVVPINLPWLTELEGMEAAPHVLDLLLESAGKVPGWKITCLVLGLKVTDTCEGGTSAKVESTTEKDVLETFNPGAPIESKKVACSIGGAGTGAITGEGLILLTNGKQDGVLVCRGYNAIKAKYRNRSDCLNTRNPGDYMPPPTVYEDYEL
jgi:hypothetical protein